MLVYSLPVLINLIIFTIILQTIIVGTVFVITSSHWLFTWVGFEINILAVILILIKKKIQPTSYRSIHQIFSNTSHSINTTYNDFTINLIYSSQWTISKIFNQQGALLLIEPFLSSPLVVFINCTIFLLLTYLSPPLDWALQGQGPWFVHQYIAGSWHKCLAQGSYSVKLWWNKCEAKFAPHAY